MVVGASVYWCDGGCGCGGVCGVVVGVGVHWWMWWCLGCGGGKEGDGGREGAAV